ncbi:hypothetical protein Clacol_004538 [Clathrus columnatus]|uniref:Uncharacterized protein n=1 Tax=Clathrus columnatus TaxID=1419009 RepID=A0AAV5A9D3_9AGAM|nr:hypothetical protein Clacol_004538 [Clathrus columnatus]
MSAQSKEDAFPNLEQKETDISLELTLKEEKQLLRHIDLRIVPYASLFGLVKPHICRLYLLCFLDRANIGQARLAGLERDLNLHGNQESIDPLYLDGMGLVTNVQGLYTTRFLLGVFEAGLFPGINFIFTMWYTRQELNVRIAVFIMGSSLSGAFGGILAFGIRHMAGVGGKNGWAWIFILEGLFTLLCAIPALWLIPDFPDTSKILTPKERTKWLHRLAISQGVTNSPLPFSTRQVTRALCDWRTYAYIADLGFTNARANLLSAAPYALAVPFTISMSYFSDKYMIRGPIIVASILVSDASETAKFVAVFLAVIGTAPSSPTAITFIARVFFSIGNLAGIPASNVYPASDAPRYIRGHSIALSFSVLCVIVAGGLSIYNYKENARRDRVYGRPNADGSDCNILYIQDEVKLKVYGLEGKTREEIIELGDRHPAFRFCGSVAKRVVH